MSVGLFNKCVNILFDWLNESKYPKNKTKFHQGLKNDNYNNNNNITGIWFLKPGRSLLFDCIWCVTDLKQDLYRRYFKDINMIIQ